ncbi:YgjV family protein [Catenovulum sediminis]|uniref:YgjV family protein n=1 Tax=Catenovulum sediminis TaxID=1740262 RepID=A0ABV1RJK3_9ALTE
MIEINTAQLIGFLSLFLGICTFLQKNDLKLKICMVFLFASQTLHFVLMGSATAAASNTLSLIRTIVCVRFSNKWVASGFINLNLLWGIYLYQSPISFLPIMGGCAGTYAVFFLEGIKMRLVFILGATFWIIHNSVIGSLGGTALEALVIITNVFTIFRIYSAKKKRLANA